MQDIALVMIIAGLTTVIFHRLRQPVVLGYILAGFIIGPHTPPFPLVNDKHTIEVMSELGVIMLMFGLGLHFSLKDLAKVGPTAFVAASLEILTMLAAGYGLGRLFGWSKLDSLFLGAILSISSTTIIIKALQDLGMTREGFAKLIFGILIVEDILAIAMLALLSGIATTGQLAVTDVVTTMGRLAVFLAVVLVAGLLVVPRVLRYIDRFKNGEVLLIASLGVCFGVSLVAARMGYSVALGAFLAGAIVAEARERGKIDRVVEPVRDMFSAIFFVAIGMMIEPALLITYAVPILVITAVVIVGKIITCAVGTFITGHPPKTALRVGMGVSQIGEFSFIIASLGLSLGVISKFLYPIAVAVSAITTLLTPFLIKNSDRFGDWLGRVAPDRLRRYVSSYGQRVGDPTKRKKPPVLPAEVKRMLRRWGVMTGLNVLLITGIFIAAPFVALRGEQWIPRVFPEWSGGVRSLVWLAATAAALPLIVVTVQKLRAGSMLLAEIYTEPSLAIGASKHTTGDPVIVSRTLFTFGNVLLGLWLVLLSIAVLPPWPVALSSLVLLGLLVAWRWRAFTRLYARGQAALEETLQDTASDADHDEQEASPPVLPGLFNAQILSVDIKPGSPVAGKMIVQIELRTATGASAVAIDRPDVPSIINPGPYEELLSGDKVILLGRPEQLEAARKLLEGEPA
ncbi:MAG: cation:proton antiporter [Candidatus Sumerlaeaceae bacterium]|nr:cation:proton antiporter [Candidatus Sumerlaeaceae bacterium]